MTVLTKKRERLLDQLVELAGDPLIVQEALRELNSELATPPNVEQIVRRILELKEKEDRALAEIG